MLIRDRQIVKEFPGAHAVWAAQPDIRGGDSACKWNVFLLKQICQYLRISHVVCNGFHALFDALVRQCSLCSSLYYIGHAIEFGCLSAFPKLVEFGSVCGYQFYGHDGPCAAGSCKASCFGKTADFHGTGAGPFNFVDAVRIISLDKRLSLIHIWSQRRRKTDTANYIGRHGYAYQRKGVFGRQGDFCL